MKHRREIGILTALVRPNTRAIERFDQTPSRPTDLLERIRDEIGNGW